MRRYSGKIQFVNDPFLNQSMISNVWNAMVVIRPTIRRVGVVVCDVLSMLTYLVEYVSRAQTQEI